MPARSYFVPLCPQSRTTAEKPYTGNDKQQRDMNGYQILKIQEHPELKTRAAAWFHAKWNIPAEAYLSSIDECIRHRQTIPQWYVALAEDRIIGGLGVIENDFHNRKDLSPNLCAVYVEKEFRCRGIAGTMLSRVCNDMALQGIPTLYLVTEHTSFYERYGWQFLCTVQEEAPAENKEGKENTDDKINGVNEKDGTNEKNERNKINERNETNESNEINEGNGANEISEANEGNGAKETSEANEGNGTNETNEANENNETNEVNQTNDSNKTTGSNEANHDNRQPGTMRMYVRHTRPISFVSLGPGEAELITLKGLKALQNADCIFCPETPARNGSLLSRAADILHRLGIPAERIRRFPLPMSKQRGDALHAYDQVYATTLSLHRTGKKVAIVAEGDAGLYSSIHYIYEKLQAGGTPVEQIAGIPAFIAAGARGGLHIASQEERLTVIPGITTAEEIERLVQSRNTVVIMKLSQCTGEVHRCIRLHPEYDYRYFENVGTPQEKYLSDGQQIATLRFPYFSLLIIRHTGF